LNFNSKIVNDIEQYCKKLNQCFNNEELKYKYLELIMINIQLASLNELEEIYIVFKKNIRISHKKHNYFVPLKNAVSCLQKLEIYEIPRPENLSIDYPHKFYNEILEYCKLQSII